MQLGAEIDPVSLIGKNDVCVLRIEASLLEIPLVRAVREAGDRGIPLVAAEPSHPASRAFREAADRILVRLAVARDAVAEREGLDVLT